MFRVKTPDIMSQRFKVHFLTVALAYAPLLLFAQDTLITFSGDTPPFGVGSTYVAAPSKLRFAYLAKKP